MRPNQGRLALVGQLAEVRGIPVAVPREPSETAAHVNGGLVPHSSSSQRSSTGSPSRPS